MTLLLTADPTVAESVRLSFSHEPEVLSSAAEVRRRIAEQPDTELVVVGPDVDIDDAFALAEAETATRPDLGIVLMRRRVDTAVLAQALHFGVRDVVKSDDVIGLGEACRRSRDMTRRLRGLTGVEVSAHGAPSLGRVVTVFSAKGGCGKTTLATNLAAAFAEKARVCLVDLDLDFGDVGIALQLTPERGLADAAALAGRLDETGVRSLVTPYRDRLDTILAPMKPGVSESLPASVIGELLDVARTMFDVVVVDTPPAFNEHALTAFDRTDSFVLLSTLDVPSVKNLKLAMEMLQMLHYPADRAHVVLNRADARVGLSVRDTEAALGARLAALIPSSRDVPAATNRGVPIVLDRPGHAVSQAVRRLAVDVLPAPARDTGTHAATVTSRARFRPLRLLSGSRS